MYTVPEQICQRLDRLFPDAGEAGSPPLDTDPELFELVHNLEEFWIVLPEKIQDRVQKIQHNFNRRHIPLVLYISQGSD